MGVKLLSREQTKIIKSRKFGYAPVIMHLQPYKFMGKNLCPAASAGCASSCLVSSGKMGLKFSVNARQKRTRLFWENRQAFMAQLTQEIERHRVKSLKNGLKPCVRLNGTSDIQWEKIAPELFTRFSDVIFYDYTKIAKRFFGELPSNYFLTFSRSENNEIEAEAVAKAGGNVAVVFADKFPSTYMGRPVHDGEEHDLRFLDPRGVVVGLRAKGKARHDTSGFVVAVG
jgi:hypothetical protein